MVIIKGFGLELKNRAATPALFLRCHGSYLTLARLRLLAADHVLARLRLLAVVLMQLH